MTAPRRIGILTGGGDCPGINAVIRAVAKPAILHHGIEVLGIEDGFEGLVQNRVRRLMDEDVSGILTLGGTILGSNNKCDPRRYHDPLRDGEVRDATDDCLQTISDHRIEALVVIGGDGTHTLAHALAQRSDINIIGVPKTIDNDLPGADITFGFLTAVATATDAIDRVHTTGRSHNRVMLVEVMGRNAGWLALFSGVASGADVILLPEIPYDESKIVNAIQARRARGKRYTIVCVAEGARPVGGKPTVARVDPTSPDPIRLGGVAQVLAHSIEDKTGMECRATVLGHVQRGGSPIAADRILATQYGHHALRLLVAGARRRTVGRQNGVITDVPLELAASGQRLVPRDHSLIAAARDLGTAFGD